MSVYRLPCGQYGYTGHILNIPQDITTFINNLSRCPASLDVIIVRKNRAAQSHRDFRVRRSVVLTSLLANNPYYHDVTINHHTLSQLPGDSDLTDFLPVHILPDDLPEIVPQQDDNINHETDTVPLHSTFIPITIRDLNEQQRIEESILNPQHVNWPSTTGNPVNEFTTEDYMSCAFPTISNWCSRFFGTMVADCYNWKLFQAFDVVL